MARIELEYHGIIYSTIIYNGKHYIVWTSDLEQIGDGWYAPLDILVPSNEV